MPRDRQALPGNALAVRQPQSLTASARQYSPGRAAKSVRKVNRRTRSRDWQAILWDHYDMVPEFRAAVDWVGNSLSSAQLLVLEDGKETTNQVALDAVASLFNGPEGQREMLRLLGVNFTIAGEAWVIGEAGDDDFDRWRVAAAVEVTGESNVDGRLVVEGEALDPDALPIRMWKAHARNSMEPHSPARAVLPILNQIVKLTMVIDAQADSRLTSAGILWVPSEIEVPGLPISVNDGETTTQLEGTQALYQRLIDIAMTAIENRDSAAAQVPIVISAPGEYLEKIQKTDFWSGFDEHVHMLRKESIARIGTGMDMPPEVLTGTSDVNHWGAWQIEEAAIKSYTEPLLQVILSALTEGYLWPLLQDEGVPNWDSFRFGANTAQMRLRPNRSKEAVELWDRGVLSTKAMLVENGFDPDVDIMPDNERIMWLLTKVGSGSPAPDQVAAALEQLGVKGLPREDEAPGQELERVREPQPPRTLRHHPVRTAPDPEKSEAASAVQASAAMVNQPFVVDGLVLAAEQMVFRALERAGNRLKNRVGRDLGCHADEIYLQAPELSTSEWQALLEDAWTRVDRFEYPVDRDRLREALNRHTLMLLRLRKPYSRQSLATHLLLDLAEDTP